jgi:hypothetical protein
VFFLFPTWLLVILGFLIALCLPIRIIRDVIASARRREQAAISAKHWQAYLDREALRRREQAAIFAREEQADLARKLRRTEFLERASRAVE